MNSSSTDVREIRKFGAVAVVFFGSLTGLAFWKQKLALKAIFGLLALTGLGLLLLPGPLSPVYRAWMKAAHLIGRTMTIVMLTLAFYLVITPAGLIKRVFGGAPLPLEPDRSASSYWVARKEPAQPRERFRKRY